MTLKNHRSIVNILSILLVILVATSPLTLFASGISDTTSTEIGISSGASYNPESFAAPPSPPPRAADPIITIDDTVDGPLLHLDGATSTYTKHDINGTPATARPFDANTIIVVTQDSYLDLLVIGNTTIRQISAETSYVNISFSSSSSLLTVDSSATTQRDLVVVSAGYLSLIYDNYDPLTPTNINFNIIGSQSVPTTELRCINGFAIYNGIELTTSPNHVDLFGVPYEDLSIPFPIPAQIPIPAMAGYNTNSSAPSLRLSLSTFAAPRNLSSIYIQDASVKFNVGNLMPKNSFGETATSGAVMSIIPMININNSKIIVNSTNTPDNGLYLVGGGIYMNESSIEVTGGKKAAMNAELYYSFSNPDCSITGTTNSPGATGLLFSGYKAHPVGHSSFYITDTDLKGEADGIGVLVKDINFTFYSLSPDRLFSGTGNIAGISLENSSNDSELHWSFNEDLKLNATLKGNRSDALGALTIKNNIQMQYGFLNNTTLNLTVEENIKKGSALTFLSNANPVNIEEETLNIESSTINITTPLYTNDIGWELDSAYRLLLVNNSKITHNYTTPTLFTATPTKPYMQSHAQTELFTWNSTPAGAFVESGGKFTSATSTTGRISGSSVSDFSSDTVDIVFTDNPFKARINARHFVNINATSIKPSIESTLNFNPMGGTVAIASKPVIVGFPVGPLPIPQKAGFVFLGWFDDPVNTTGKFTGLTIYTGSSLPTTIYAHWAPIPPNQFLVTFNANGGVIDGNQQLCLNEASLVTEPEIYYDGYLLLGWYSSPTFEENTKWNFATDVTPAANLNLYAKWELIPPSEYLVSFFPNGGAIDGDSHITLAAGALIPEPEVIYDGYTLLGWYTNTKLKENSKWDFAVDKMPARNISLYAKWQKNSPSEHTVCFYKNDGIIDGSSQLALSAGDLIPKPTITRNGYVLVDWYTTANFATGTKWDFAVNTMPNGNLKLYALWHKIDPSTETDANYDGSSTPDRDIHNQNPVEIPPTDDPTTDNDSEELRPNLPNSGHKSAGNSIGFLLATIGSAFLIINKKRIKLILTSIGL